MTEAYIFDSETTGVIEPEVVEAAWLKLVSPKDLSFSCKFLQRYHPSKPIELGALSTHHILDECLADCPESATFKLPADCGYMIGHKVDYDWSAIGSPPIKRIDTLSLCRAFWPDLDSHSQGAVIYHLEREMAQALLGNAHSALADVLNCRIILEHIMKATHWTVESWEQLWQMSEKARIPLKAPFGKYKGQPINVIPRQYAKWAMNQPDFDPYFMQAMKEQCL